MNIKSFWDGLDKKGKANFVAICLAPILVLILFIWPEIFYRIESVGLVLGVIFLFVLLLSVIKR